MYSPPDPAAYNALVWLVVQQIPPGLVSTYGQVASIIPPPPGVDDLQYRRLGARWVGVAMHVLPDGTDVPWQRVINSQGQISPRKHSQGHIEQRRLLDAEGVRFDEGGRVDFALYGWGGPDPAWLVEHGLRPPRSLSKPDAAQPRLF